MTPADTRAALGGDYPFVEFRERLGQQQQRCCFQRLINAYVKTLKFIHSHTAAEIADRCRQLSAPTTRPYM